MKYRFLILFVAIVSFGIVACDFNSHTEPELNYNKAKILGDEIYINQSDDKPHGVDSLYINEGDTLLLKLTTRLLEDPEYQWTIEDNSVFEILPIADDPNSFYAVAKSDSGTTTSFTLKDNINEAEKEMQVVVTKFWADPDIFILLGRFGGHCYYISRSKITWPEANYNCDLAGGYLPCIATQEEHSFLFNAMMELDMGETWIGIRYEPTGDGGFTLLNWINGDGLTFEYFENKDGVDGFNARYFFAMLTTEGGLWNNYAVADRYNYFLELE